MSVNNTRDLKSSTTSSKAGIILLQITCGICAALSLLCCLLIAYIILISNSVSSVSKAPFDYRSKSLLRNVIEKDLTRNDHSFRLPNEIKPQHYDLFLHPDLTSGTFRGKVIITLDVLLGRRSIILHQKGLNVTTTRLDVIDDDRISQVDIENSYNVDEIETHVVMAKSELHPGRYNLTMEFDGDLKNKIVGFYWSKYKNEQNETRFIATSKFEPTYARRCFPCFDEPDFKAEFTIHLVRPAEECYNALSNMNVESVAVNKPSSGLSTVTFAKSVPMATYVTCFIVSDFVATTANAKSWNGKRLPISIYTTRSQKEKGKYALSVGIRVIEYYMNLFKVPYPLPKLDMAAIPDFISGAMENWGLVTFRESKILYDAKTSSTNQKENIALIIAHEFAHMWFGNSVTMKWWNDLWLNEGFANFMAYKCINELFPEWNIMNRFLTSLSHVAYKTDEKVSSHPIVQNVRSPDEITAIFDVITYDKGAAIIRMLENFVGPRIFANGISSYLSTYAYENAETADLLNILQKTVQNQINITSIVDTWTRQMGFPVVNVARHKNTYTLTQKRFLVNPDVKYRDSESEFRYRWTIPITFITSKKVEPTLVWFDAKADKLVIKLDEPVEWIKINCEQVGYYRVNYEAEEWQALVDVLRWNHKRFSDADRAHILEDAFSLAESSQLDYSTAMDITTYLPNEKNDVAWKVAKSALVKLDHLLRSTQLSTSYRNYVKNIIDSTYHDVTWEVDNIDDIGTLHLRTIILSLACSVGHTECLEDAKNIFKVWLRNPEYRLHPDIRSLLFHYGMNYNGREESWNILFEKFVNETNTGDKLDYMYGLTGIQNTNVLMKFINIVMDETYVRSQDALNCLSLISANPSGTPLVWDWVRENWELLVERYTLNDRYLGRLIPSITKTFASKTKLDEMMIFFEKYPEAGAGKSYRLSALETVENNIKWLDRNLAKLEKWLEDHPELTKSF